MHTEVKPFYRVIINLIFVFMCLICIIPLITVISISLSEEMELLKNGYSIIPRNLTFHSYVFIFKDATALVRSYGISIFTTIVGTISGLIIYSLIAYPLSRPDFQYRKFITIFLAITMYFHGGLVPTYILLTRYLHLKNSLLVLILPYLTLPWYIILLRTFFSKIPFSLVESAMIDGSGEWRTLFKIILPLSKPALATVGLFLALIYWNDWWLPLIYIDRKALYPLQFLLYSIMRDAQELANDYASIVGGFDAKNFPGESMRMAMCVVAAGPMLCVFPFFQKYFVKGLTVGAVKG